jgi:hypothetical protein
MEPPLSFCTIATKQCKHELVGFLLSLSIHHQNTNVYVMCDEETKQEIMNLTPYPRLNINFIVNLDKYSKYNRDEMNKLKIWDEFQMKKADVIYQALEYETDTLFLDSDIIITGQIFVDKTKNLGVSPHYIRKSDSDKYGFFNGGALWTSNKSVRDKWIEYTKKSRYHDQASIEDLVRDSEFSVFLFGEEYNMSWWRLNQSDEPPAKIASYFGLNPKTQQIFYKNKELKFIHTHFNDSREYKAFNNLMKELLKKSQKYKELAIIYRMINKQWTITIPKQPLPDKWHHTNDSFRELVTLLPVKNKDLQVYYSPDCNNCWLVPNIMLYDRDTLGWIEKDYEKASLVMFSCCSVSQDSQELCNKGIKIKPWTYWPRYPKILEKILTSTNNKILDYDERTTESIFIGNFENKVQEQFRNNPEWENVLTEYHCTAGKKHIFTGEEYLIKLSNSRYGLCLRGYGRKCHREVELMAFGTVPIITQHVDIESYINPPVENVHFIRVNEPKNLKEKLEGISKEEWLVMSQNCHKWYMENVHSDNMFKTTIASILYD